MTPGAVVVHRRYANVAWVVRRLRDDGLIDLIAKATDGDGRSHYQGLPASPGDLTEHTPAPLFSPGDVVTRNGVQHTVLEDMGAAVRFEVGASSKELRGWGRLHLPSGNTTTIAKSDIVIENIA